MDYLEIRTVPGRGRGIFAKKVFKVGDVIEVCPVIVLTPAERKQLEGNILDWYIYPWTTQEDAAVVLGYGFLYNHSNQPNADYQQNYESKTMTYTAICPISVGDEITINYGDSPNDATFPEWMKEMPHS